MPGAEVFAVDYNAERMPLDVLENGSWSDIALKVFDKTAGEYIAKTFKRASFVAYDQVSFSNPTNFVTNVIRETGRRKLRRLIILDHGYAIYYSDINKTVSQLEFGHQRISSGNFSTYARDFAKLKPYFDAQYGRVIFLNCFAGMDSTLLHRFAKTWGVPVTGSMQGEPALEALAYSGRALHGGKMEAKGRRVPSHLPAAKRLAGASPRKATRYKTVYPDGRTVVSTSRPV